MNGYMVKRKALLRTFDELRGQRVISVRAPAGYGKTTVVNQWLETFSHDRASINADEYDNNMAEFCARVGAALRVCQPNNKKLAEVLGKGFDASEECLLRAISVLSSRKRSVFVFDDLHMISDAAVLRLIFVILGRLPRNFQIILISRNELSTEFSELLLKGNLVQIGAVQLLFSAREIVMLHKMQGKKISHALAEEILEKTHGWAIAINAYLLSEENEGRIKDKVTDYIEKYFVKNIWQNWPEETRNFLLSTSFLQKLMPEICEKVSGRGHGALMLETLHSTGAFIKKIEKNVYEYHPLFREFLQGLARQTSERFARSVQGIEGFWHLANRDFFAAVACFVQNEDHDGIAKCFDFLEGTRYEGLFSRRLLPILREKAVRDAAETHPRIHRFLAFRALAEADRAALDAIPAEPPEIPMHMPLLHRGGREILGDSDRDVIRAGIYFERGRLEKARNHALAANITATSSASIDTRLSAMYILISILDAEGNLTEPAALLTSAAWLIEEKNAPYMKKNFDAFVARRQFAKKDKPAALKWLEAHPPAEPDIFDIFAAFTTARALILTERHNEAIILLGKILKIAEDFDRVLDKIEANILTAIAFWKTKSTDAALDHMDAAVRTACPHGFTRLFSDDAAQIGGMLNRLKNRLQQRPDASDTLKSFTKMLHYAFGSRLETDEPPTAKFTQKQEEIMTLLVQGKSYREMAEELGIKYTSVRTRLDSVYNKLNVTNAADAVARINAM